MKHNDNEIVDLVRLNEIDTSAIPAAIAQLAAAQSALAGRLLAEGAGTGTGCPRGDRLLDVHEAAAKLGCSVAHLYHNTTTLPFVVRGVGRKLKFSEAGIDKWIRSRSGR